MVRPPLDGYTVQITLRSLRAQDSSDGHHTWGAIGVSQNVIEASWAALIDSIAYGVRRIARERAGAS